MRLFFLFTNKSAVSTAKALDAFTIFGIYETFLYKTENWDFSFVVELLKSGQAWFSGVFKKCKYYCYIGKKPTKQQNAPNPNLCI